MFNISKITSLCHFHAIVTSLWTCMPYYIIPNTSQKTLHITKVELIVVYMINNRFCCLFTYLCRNISKITSRMSFSCNHLTSGRSDIHDKYHFGILYSSKYITEDSPCNESRITSDLNVQ